MAWHFDYLVVGSGFAGLVMAERAAACLGRTSLVVERRGHIGGNAADRYDDHSVLVHTYGPHYFRTNSPKVRGYLSRFTDWHPCDYRILSHTRGRYWNFPINLNTFEQFLGRPSTTAEMEAWLAAHRVHIENPSNSEEVIVSQVGRELYELFFEGYTLKQWRRHPRELDASVCGRIPVRTNRDDRYLREDFQALPAAGYSRLFENLLASCRDRVRVLLNTDFREILPHVTFGHLVYTGAIDEFYGYAYGRLPYRSLRFEAESFDPAQLASRLPIAGKPGFWQPAVQVNYPAAEVTHTRILEFKHITGLTPPGSTIIREFPKDWTPDDEPFYPVPADDAKAAYRRYAELAAAEENTSFIGRLATYRYYNMDQVTGMALAEADRLISRYSTHA